MRQNLIGNLRRAATVLGGILIAAATMSVADRAGASPLAAGKGMTIDSQLLPVRDGCGPGMRFSNSRQSCVEDFDRGPQRFDDRREFRRDFRRGEDCGRGMRFSNSRQRCVFIDEDRRDDSGAAAAAVAVGVMGAVIGAAAASNSDNNRRNGAPNNVQRRRP
jgi:hypothetical protein